MENKLVAVEANLDKVLEILAKAKSFIGEDESKVIEEALQAVEVLADVVDALEEVEMAKVDFAGINLDQAFENNPVSDYVQAGIDYVSGDETAMSRMMEAASRITGTQIVTSEEGATNLLNNLLEREEALAVQLEKDLKEIERVLEGTKIDNWTEDQVELARYFLQFQPDTSLNEVDMLTPQGVKMVWKRRRYVGAAK